MRFRSLWQDHLKTRFLHFRRSDAAISTSRPPAPAGSLTLLAPFRLLGFRCYGRVSDQTRLWDSPFRAFILTPDNRSYRTSASHILSTISHHPQGMNQKWPSTPEINSRRKATQRWKDVTPFQPASALLGFGPLRLSPHPPRSGFPGHPPTRLPATEPKLHRRRRPGVFRTGELAGLSRVCWPLWSFLPRLSKTDSLEG